MCFKLAAQLCDGLYEGCYTGGNLGPRVGRNRHTSGKQVSHKCDAASHKWEASVTQVVQNVPPVECKCHTSGTQRPTSETIFFNVDTDPSH